MPSPSPDLDRAARNLEALPLDTGQALSTISGAILRIFTRINQLEQKNAGLAHRLQDLEKARAVSRGRNEFVIPPRSPGRARV